LNKRDVSKLLGQFSRVSSPQQKKENFIPLYVRGHAVFGIQPPLSPVLIPIEFYFRGNLKPVIYSAAIKMK
jgi:hypothetical protein